jgi:hypothetical protein
MNNKFSFSSQWISMITVMYLLIVVSCNRNFDEPPFASDPNLTATLTIQDLKNSYQGTGIFKRITDDKIISGVVIADDRSGNFYKQIVIQDATGGIPVLMESSDLYTSYPIGRRVYIKVKGLLLGDYSGNIQLGADSSRSGAYLDLVGIPSAQFDQYVVKGSFGNVITPKVVKTSDFTNNITDPLLNTLVQFNNMEFATGDTSKTYADPKLMTSNVNFTVGNCDGDNIVLRNSSYARFAGLKVPKGNGPLVGVPEVYVTSKTTTLQMYIRDTSDVQFNGSRCGSDPVVAKTIGQIRAMYQGTGIRLNNYAIGGVIISDVANKNIATNGFIMQSGNSGIYVYIPGSSITYNVGDSIVLNVRYGDSLINYRNSLELKMQSGTAVPTTVATGKSVAPVVKTTADVNNFLNLPLGDPNNFEYTLVRINSASVPNGTFSGNKNLTDAAGTAILYTAATATFASSATPRNTPDWVGYAYNYNTTKEFSIRNLNDIIGAVFPPPTSAFSAIYDFGSVTTTSGTTDPSAAPTVSGITFGSFSAIGVGTNSSGSGRFSFPGWGIGATNASDVFSGAIDLGKYYEVTITPNSGVLLDLTKITFTFQRSGSGVRQASIKGSVDGFVNNLPASIDPTVTVLSVVPTNVIQITDATTTATNGSIITLGTDYTNLSTPVKFRFYSFNAESTGGTFSIDNVTIEGATH